MCSLEAQLVNPAGHKVVNNLSIVTMQPCSIRGSNLSPVITGPSPNLLYYHSTQDKNGLVVKISSAKTKTSSFKAKISK